MNSQSPEQKCKLRTCSCPPNKNNKKLKSQDDAECDWFINSPDHNNCFWTYVKAKSGPDGSMSELVQSEIAELMGWSNTKTHFMLKTAIQELVEALKAANANELLEEGHSLIVELPDVSELPDSES